MSSSLQMFYFVWDSETTVVMRVPVTFVTHWRFLFTDKKRNYLQVW